MKVKRAIQNASFWLTTFLWLPAAIVLLSLLRFGLDILYMDSAAVLSLVPAALFGLPLALGCRWLWRLNYRRTSTSAWVVLGAMTMMMSLPAGLLGPVAIAVVAGVSSLPVWGVAFWLSRKKRKESA